MIMIHPDTIHINEAHMYKKGWLGRHAPTAGELAKYVTTYANSPCMWGGGIRERANFRFADWFALDFDEGMTLEEAVKIFSPYIHIIATSKSHQKAKGKTPACDRFRVFLRFIPRCVDRYDYEATADVLIKKYKADKCRDAARFFWPCREVISLKYWGDVVEPVDAQEIARKKAHKLKAYKAKQEKLYPGKNIPCSIDNMLRYGVAENRNNASYLVAINLAERGYSEHEIFSKIWNSPIPLNASETVEREIRGAVSRAFGKARK